MKRPSLRSSVVAMMILGHAGALHACCSFVDGFELGGDVGFEVVSSEIAIEQIATGWGYVQLESQEFPTSVIFGVEGLPAGVTHIDTGAQRYGGDVTLFFKTTEFAPGGTYPLKIFARRPGSGWGASRDATLEIVPGALYSGVALAGGHGDEWKSWAVSPAGDRCDWLVSYDVDIEADWDTLTPSLTGGPGGGVVRIFGTRTSTPVVPQVGTTNCIGSVQSVDASGGFLPFYPHLTARIDFVGGSSTNTIFVRGEADEHGVHFSGTLRWEYSRTDGAEHGSSMGRESNQLSIWRQ